MVGMKDYAQGHRHTRRERTTKELKKGKMGIRMKVSHV
jgi:hypothetical protein